nr:hypothetical protein [bacterium]
RCVFTALPGLGAAAAGPDPISAARPGVYPGGAGVVTADGTAPGARYNGCFAPEPVSGPYTGVWIYTGVDPAVAVGDLVDVKGLYEEYYDFTEVNVTTDVTGYLTYVGPHMGTLTAANVTVSMLNADPEPWESVFVQVTNGMVVTAVPNGYGEWMVESYEAPGQFMMMDDYWYDDTTVLLGDCYDCAVGIYMYAYGVFRLQPHEDNICVVDCAVANESLSFGQVKALYR